MYTHFYFDREKEKTECKLSENVVTQLMQFLRSRYIYAQCRVNAGFLLDGMTTQTLKIVVACHYLQHHTAHRRFVNINLSDMARLVLEERGHLFIHLRAIDRIRHLLPAQPAPAVNEVNEQAFQVPEHILLLPVQLEVNEEVEGEEHPVQQFPLPQRRAADYKEVIEVVDLIDDDDD